MEDQRAEEIWWENEIRSGRNPSKGCECPFGKNEVPLQLRPECFQPVPQKELSDILVEATAQHFGIKSEEGKCNLKIMFDSYAQCKMREQITKAFSGFVKDK